MRAIHKGHYASMQKHKECLRMLYNAETSVSLNTASAFIFMREVGANDKNGVPIYEGDIVKISEPKSGMHNQLVYHVKFENFGFDPFCIKNWEQSLDPDECEIIGNIYQNEDIARSFNLIS